MLININENNFGLTVLHFCVYLFRFFRFSYR